LRKSASPPARTAVSNNLAKPPNSNPWFESDQRASAPQPPRDAPQQPSRQRRTMETQQPAQWSPHNGRPSSPPTPIAALWSPTQDQRTHTPSWPLFHSSHARVGCRPLASGRGRGRRGMPRHPDASGRTPWPRLRTVGWPKRLPQPRDCGGKLNVRSLLSSPRARLCGRGRVAAHSIVRPAPTQGTARPFARSQLPLTHSSFAHDVRTFMI